MAGLAPARFLRARWFERRSMAVTLGGVLRPVYVTGPRGACGPFRPRWNDEDRHGATAASPTLRLPQTRARCYASTHQWRSGMSSPQLRRADRVMTETRALQLLQRGFAGRVATIGDDGYPYCVPLLYVCMDDQVFVHTTSAPGHFH